MVSLLAFLHPRHQGKLSNTTPASSPNATLASGRGRPSSPPLMPSAPAHSPPHKQGQIYCAAQAASWGPNLPSATASKGQPSCPYDPGFSHLLQAAGIKWEKGISPSLTLPHSQLSPTPASRASSPICPGEGLGWSGLPKSVLSFLIYNYPNSC